MKKCFKCGLEKDLTEFYRHSKMLDGHVNKCKTCNKKDVTENYFRNLEKPGYKEKERKRGRVKYHALYGPGTNAANVVAVERWQNKYPEKRLAAQSSQHLILIDATKERHHWSYEKIHWKDIIELTKREHMKAHRFMVYDQEQLKYRRFDTNELLDTKQKHIDFIFKCINEYED